MTLSKTVLLINPPAFNLLVSSDNKHNLRATELISCPPVNLLYLASYLKKEKPEIKIIVKDYIAEDFSAEGFGALLKTEQPFLVGITCFSTNLPETFETARAVKRFNPDIAVIVGGPHTAIFAKETVKQPFIDLVCQGEGEKALVETVQKLLDGKPAERIDNIWIKQNGEVTAPKTAFKNAFGDIDNAPYPDTELVGVKNYYHPFLYNNGGTITAITGRGCPFKCTYCNSANRVPRLRKMEKVIDEIAYNAEKFNVRNLFLLDDTFNISGKRMLDFSQLITEREIKINWAFRGRVNALNEKTLEAAKKAGLVHIAIGVEDFTDEGLKKIRKDITVKDVKRAFKLCREYGVKTTANFIIGLPHNQHRDTQLKLIDFINELNPTTIQTFVLILIPGSEMYDDAVRDGILTGREWVRQAENPSDDFETPGWHGDMSISEQFEINSIINRRFYLRPGYILKQLFEIKSLKELSVKVDVGFSLIRTAFHQKGRIISR